MFNRPLFLLSAPTPFFTKQKQKFAHGLDVFVIYHVIYSIKKIYTAILCDMGITMAWWLTLSPHNKRVTHLYLAWGPAV